MNQMDLFEHLTDIDDDLIVDADNIAVPQQCHFSPRRFCILLAAVITVLSISVAAVATMTEDLDAKLLRFWNLMVKGGYNGYFTYDEYYQYELHRDTEQLDGHEVEINLTYMYNLNQAELWIACEGKTLQVKLEAMVLMDDGMVKYKSRTVESEDDVTVTLDNVIAGEPGTIVHLRRTISLLGEAGWKMLPPRSSCIANDFGFQIPVGIDIRFPDTKRENYHWWEPFHHIEADQAAVDEVRLPGNSKLIATVQ